MTFTIDETLQIRPRSWLRPQSLFKQLWKTTRIVHYTSGIFSVCLKPASTKRASDIWRMDSQQTYVKGEENLSNWKPRGIGLVRDYVRAQQRKRRATEIEATKAYLRRHRVSAPLHIESEKVTTSQQNLLKKCLTLWTTSSDTLPSSELLSTTPASTKPFNPIKFSPSAVPDAPPLTAEIHTHPKNPVLLKSSFLLTPNPTSHAWTRHFAELRPPYLHLYAVPSGSETATINLRNARIDIDPPVQRLLNGEGGSGARKNVFAVYARGGSWLFAARTEEERSRWVLAIDEGFVGDDGLENL